MMACKEKSVMQEEYWRAVRGNDVGYDGQFFYGVRTTGIFCRPSCKSRIPLKENVRYFEMMEEALDAGFRPCKRCRPDLVEYEPKWENAGKMKRLIETHYEGDLQLRREMSRLGSNSHRLNDQFNERYGMTPRKYLGVVRVKAAKERLHRTEESILEIARGCHRYQAGYGSGRARDIRSVILLRRLLIRTKGCLSTGRSAMDVVSAK